MAKRGETRQRIVQGAREAFNTLRYGQVTTALLAERLGLSEGNLWYHFKTKRALLTAIQADFLQDTQALLEPDTAIEDPAMAYCTFLTAWRDLFSQYLFVFRDRRDYGEHSPDLFDAFPRLYAALEARVSGLFTAMAKAGLLNVEAEEVEDLVFNTILVTRFYFEFQDERLGLAAAQTDTASDEAVLRHQSLLKDKLSPDVAEQARLALQVDA